MPIAILLPSTAMAPEAVALLCARKIGRQTPTSPAQALDRLPAGHRVRVLPDEGVYEFAGGSESGYWLQLLDIKNVRSDGRLWVPPKDAARLEPTQRWRPLGGPNRQRWAPLHPTTWDRFAGTKLCGNAGLSQLSVVVIGSRADFMLALETLGFAGAAGAPGISVENGLPWGRVDEDGSVELLHPTGASGEPLIAVARDHVSARRLAADRDPGTLVFVSARGDDALNDRTSVELLAERHACLVIAPGRLREGFVQRRQEGWSVGELSASSALEAVPTGIRNLDRVSEASTWMGRAPATLAQPSRELEEAFQFLDTFSRAAGPHLQEDDDVAEVADLLRQAFFEASDWLAAPTNEDLEELAIARESVWSFSPRLKSVAGERAADAARAMAATIEIFARTASEKSMTPKGECLLRLAEKAGSGGRYAQVIVTGHRRNASAITAFLDDLGVPMACVTPTELAKLSEVQRINVLSVMRRDAFTRLVDPWAAPDVMFLGYQHEVNVYLQRLKHRERAIQALRPDEELERRLPRLAGLRRPASSSVSAPAPAPESVAHDPLAPPPRRRPQPGRTGEVTKPARYCRFAGRSWMAVTDDHAFARVQLGRDQKTQVVTASAKDLQVGDLILVREGGEKDVVREMAEQLAGPENYSRLRTEAGFWRKKLRAAGLNSDRLRKVLADEGLDRGLPTLRYWMADEGPIGPHDPDSALPLIASALGENPEGRDWKACLAAIHAVRRHHVGAGFRLTEVLINECGSAIVEHSEHETPLELSVGTAWLLEVEQLDAERHQWPQGQVNRLQWESDGWKRRLLRAAGSRNSEDANNLLRELFPDGLPEA